MSQIRLFIDEDSMDRRFVRALRGRGVDVITVGEIGTTSLSDEAQLILAIEQQRVLYTFNVGDFCQLHYTWLAKRQTHTGIVISSQTYSVGEQVRRILNLIAMQSAEAMVDQLVFLSAYAVND
jgi:hypothetical protein